jgi:hypothetical protein
MNKKEKKSKLLGKQEAKPKTSRRREIIKNKGSNQ